MTIQDIINAEIERIKNSNAEILAKNPKIIEFSQSEPKQFPTIDIENAKRITSSYIPHLLKNGRKKTDVSSVAMDYIMTRALESVGLKTEQVYGKALDWGNENEPLAIAELEEFWGVPIEFAGENQEYVKHPHIHMAGFADGYVELDGEKWAIEVKCPHSPLVHHKRTKYIDYQDVIKNDYDLYVQCMCHLLLSEFSQFGKCVGTKCVSFDPRRSTHRIKVVDIFWCDETVQLIENAVNKYAQILFDEIKFIIQE